MRFFIFFLLLFGLNAAFAQTQSDSIFVAKNFWGYKFYQKDTRLNINALPIIMDDNIDALSIVTKAKTNNIISAIIGGTGGFLIGLQLGTAIVGGESNWTVAAIGGGLVVISIPISSRAINQSIEAINLYNAGLQETSNRLYLKMGLTQTGVGLKLIF